jgi:hypothetical protein
VVEKRAASLKGFEFWFERDKGRRARIRVRLYCVFGTMKFSGI